MPRAPTLLLAARTDNPAPPVETKRTDPVLTASVSVPARVSGTPAAQSQSKVVYRVKKGDTLASIARVFQTTVSSLKKWNSLRSNSLRIGQRLTILSPRAASIATR